MENERISDSKWLASMVVAAYTEERYDLGEALARLCGQAHRMERDRAILPAPVPASVYSPAHVQKPEQKHVCRYASDFDSVCETCGEIRLLDSYICPVCGQGHHPSTPCPSRRYLDPDGGSNNVGEPAEEAPTRVTPSGRCIAQVGRVGGRMECHGVLYWHQYPDGVQGWVHIDPAAGGDHEPMSNRADPVAV